MIIIAIFGGSFDPPHKGHQAIVTKALSELKIDKLIIMPAFLNPFKERTLASAEERLVWCQRLFGESPKVEVSDYEISMGRPVYTSESIRHLGQHYEVSYLIIGADNLPSVKRWHEFEWINERVTWVIIERGGETPSEERLRESGLRSTLLLHIDMPTSSTVIREGGNLNMVDIRIRQEVEKLLQKN